MHVYESDHVCVIALYLLAREREKEREHCDIHILGTVEGFVFGVPLTNRQREVTQQGQKGSDRRSEKDVGYTYQKTHRRFYLFLSRRCEWNVIISAALRTTHFNIRPNFA